MRFKTTLRLFMAVCLLAILIILVDRNKPVVVRTALTDIRAGEVVELSIESGSLAVSFFKKNESWFISRPIQVRADESRVDMIVGTLESLMRQEVVTRDERDSRRLTLNDYGLHKPRVRLVAVSRRDGVERNEEVLIGNDAPLGGLLYAKLATNDEVVAVSREIMNVIPEKLEKLRDRTILHGDILKTSRLDIKKADSGFIQLARLEDGWFVQQPIVTRADSAKVNQLLDALYSLKAEDFVWDANIETGDVVRVEETAANPVMKAETYRLTPDEARVRVTVWVKGDEVGHELFLGKEAGEKSGRIYARCKGADSIYTVSESVLGAVSVGVNDVRDKNLFFVPAGSVNYVSLQKGDSKLILQRGTNEGWAVVEPVRWKADDRFVDQVVGSISRLRVESFQEGTNLVEFGLDAPACIAGLSDSVPDAAVSTNKLEKLQEKGDEKAATSVVKQRRLLIGEPREGKETVFAKFEEEPYIFEIARTTVDFLGRNPVDPLVYRDRTMFSLDPVTVKRISLLKNGVEQVIEKSEEGKWTAAVGPGTNQVNTATVDDILFAVADMRAMRTECQSPESLVQYGLDRSGTTLTFGLTGDKGVQKSLVMGFRSGTDGIYAMVQGLDVVFVIGNKMMNLLVKDLITPLQAAPVP